MPEGFIFRVSKSSFITPRHHCNMNLKSKKIKEMGHSGAAIKPHHFNDACKTTKTMDSKKTTLLGIDVPRKNKKLDPSQT